jgi:hypothetical protein
MLVAVMTVSNPKLLVAGVFAATVSESVTTKTAEGLKV